MHHVRALTIALIAATVACRSPLSSPAPATRSTGSNAELRAMIDSLADAPAFANAHWGILIVDPTSGDTLYSRNAGKLFMPASNMKILTSATALAQLGADYRFRTTFAARGAVSGGTLAGDLVVIGRGDPSVSDHMLGNAMAPLRAIADSIVARGIRHITGRVVALGDAFPGEVLGYGWSYDDFEDSYSAPTDELLFNEGFSVDPRSRRRASGRCRAGRSPTGPFVSPRARVGNHRPADGTGFRTPASEHTARAKRQHDLGNHSSTDRSGRAIRRRSR